MKFLCEYNDGKTASWHPRLWSVPRPKDHEKYHEILDGKRRRRRGKRNATGLSDEEEKKPKVSKRKGRDEEAERTSNKEEEELYGIEEEEKEGKENDEEDNEVKRERRKPSSPEIQGETSQGIIPRIHLRRNQISPLGPLRWPRLAMSSMAG